MIPRTESLNQTARLAGRFSLRGLRVLGVSAVSKRFKYIHRGDAQNRRGGAETFQPGDYQSYVCEPL